MPSMHTLHCPIKSCGASKIKQLLYTSSQVKETLLPTARTNTAPWNWLEAGAERRWSVSGSTQRNPEPGNRSWEQASPVPSYTFGEAEERGAIMPSIAMVF